MPCSHQGGTDKCEEYKGRRGCKYATKKLSREYRQANMRTTGETPDRCRDLGAAAEHFVISDMLHRGLTTTGPHNQNGADDCFVKIGRWYSVQVKVARINNSTGHMGLHHCKSTITSDLIALVDLKSKRIRWVSNNEEPVPPELL